jgi:urocanate hydratase
MTSAGVTLVADGTPEADERLHYALSNDTALGVMRYADAGYAESFAEIDNRGVPYIDLR